MQLRLYHADRNVTHLDVDFTKGSNRDSPQHEQILRAILLTNHKTSGVYLAPKTLETLLKVQLPNQRRLLDVEYLLVTLLGVRFQQKHGVFGCVTFQRFLLAHCSSKLTE